ncbi:hypothetical protein ACFU8I_28600 [Streptomyces sp. NPDC057540]
MVSAPYSPGVMRLAQQTREKVRTGKPDGAVDDVDGDIESSLPGCQ